ncbi:MAG TPA: acylneuraminate cytidylyltransferase [Abditibacteriaceae bacterium]|jgi:YrbI family 3-deoxy-D-manno-octulosonate 8-phosphate phosphatase
MEPQHTQQNIAIIPARGGSKGIPGKNIKSLCGQPLLSWTIEAAQEARHVHRVFVSTDDLRIAEVARRYGAEVIMRPDELSTDTASSESGLLHALEHLAANEVFAPELLVFLQCTSPLTQGGDIDGTVEALQRENADSALTVAPFHGFLWKQSAQHEDAVGVNHDKRVRPRRQDREAQFLETGAVYVMRATGFKQARHRFFGKTALHVTPAERSLEIDEPHDWVLAEHAMRRVLQERRAENLPSRIGALVFDFDGVFTDNRVLVWEDGQEGAVCHRGDGWGLARLKELGLPMMVLSTERNPIVAARCRKLGLECVHNVAEKGAFLRDWLRERDIDPADVIYVGNDVNDLTCLQLVGCPVVVADAHPDVLGQARIVLSKPGGYGALRELADMIGQKAATIKRGDFEE